ncbi:Inner membrane component of T3SS [Bosea lupini]|uniref:Inner membrane component of T3SS n=1 Tax=Bosea lupini TaxID=1036779 RepID=A0A1H7ZLU8_9HYPH|nr:FHA domain-containing protein [Bosea lupini]SEM59360.1 Inner membrane component of T3SS [Bosea lupini]
MTTASLASQPGRELASIPAREIGLFIEGGLHQGARLTLDSGSYRVGSAADCDIILHDDGVAPQHATLRIVDGEMRLEAVGAAIALDLQRRRILPAGSGVKPILPATIWIGQARLKLTSGAKTKGQGGPMMALAIAGVVAATGLMAAYAMASRQSPAAFVSEDRGATSTTAARIAVDQAPMAAEGLRRMLAASGLSGIVVTASGERVLASGAVEAAQAQGWAAAQQAFDAAHGGRIQLGSEVRVTQREDGPKVALQAVWLGENPYVLTADGSRHHQGAFLDNGWTIRSISKDGVTFARGERNFTLTF